MGILTTVFGGKKADEAVQDGKNKNGNVFAAAEFMDKAWAKMRKRDYKAAIGHFAEAIRACPNHVNAYFGMAQAHNYLGNPQKAHSCLEKVSENKERDYYYAGLSFEYGLACVNSGDYAGAIERFRQEISELEGAQLGGSLNGKHTLLCDCLLAKARTHLRVGEPGAAKNDIARVLEIDPKYPDAAFQMGNAMFDLGNYSHAVDYYSKEIEANPNAGAGAYHNMAIAKSHCNGTDPQSVYDSFLDAEKMEMGNPRVYFSRAVYSMELYRQFSSSAGSGAELEKLLEGVIVDCQMAYKAMVYGKIPDRKLSNNMHLYFSAQPTFDKPRLYEMRKSIAEISLLATSLYIGDGSPNLISEIRQSADKILKITGGLECLPDVPGFVVINSDTFDMIAPKLAREMLQEKAD